MLPRRMAAFAAFLLVALPLLASPLQKEMREVEPPPQAPEQAQAVDAQVVSGGPQPVPPQPPGQPTPQPAAPAARVPSAAPPPAPPQMGPGATPGTTAYMVAQQAWKPVTPPPVGLT